MQQKIQAEIQAKKEEHLTVFKKTSSLDEDMDPLAVQDAASREMETEIGAGDRPLAKSLKNMGDDSDEDDENDAEATEEKINKTENFRALGGKVVEVELMKTTKMGLGLALSGHVDRMRMGTFICGVNKLGPAGEAKGETGESLQAGDELLKVHHTVVRGRSHLNVSAIIKRLPEDTPLRFIVLRDAKTMEKTAVKKYDKFPTVLDDVIFDSPEFDKFVAKREIKMQKVKR